MSGLEVIPVMTGLVCAAAAAKQFLTSKKQRDRSKAGYRSKTEIGPAGKVENAGVALRAADLIAETLGGVYL